jgi:CTP-dependent riboflavin kinase
MHFSDWCKAEQSRLLEQIRWLETGSRHIGTRTGGGPWVDITENELTRLKLNYERIERLLAEQERELVE